MMPVMDGQSGIHLAENVQEQLVVLAFQIWFVSVILASQQRGRLLNWADAGTTCRGVEFG